MRKTENRQQRKRKVILEQKFTLERFGESVLNQILWRCFVRASCFGLHGRLKVFLIPLWDHTQALTALTLPWKRLAEQKDALCDL